MPLTSFANASDIVAKHPQKILEHVFILINEGLIEFFTQFIDEYDPLIQG
jgi:hypothetical protein